jgi:hypothetical protein
MFLIKLCPECNKKIKFPIDKGKIRVKCICGYSFIADPDDSNIYKNSKFDIKPKTKNNLIQKYYLKISRLNYEEIKIKVINYLFNLKYKIQNFKHQPGNKQKKIILYLILVILFVVFLSSII